MMKKILSMILVSFLLIGCTETKKDSLTITDINPKDIVTTLGGMCDYAVSYGGIGGLSKNSEVVIYGKVKEIQYLCGGNGWLRTNMEVEVIQSMKGDYKAGDTIKIVKDQGIVTISDYINSYQTDEQKALYREDYKKYTDAELDKLYIQQVEMFDVMVEKEQASVFFLKKSSFYDTDQTYSRLNGPDGEYTEIEENKFVPTHTISQCLTEPYLLSTYKEPDNSESVITSYTLEEIIAQMELE